MSGGSPLSPIFAIVRRLRAFVSFTLCFSAFLPRPPSTLVSFRSCSLTLSLFVFFRPFLDVFLQCSPTIELTPFFPPCMVVSFFSTLPFPHHIFSSISFSCHFQTWALTSPVSVFVRVCHLLRWLFRCLFFFSSLPSLSWLAATTRSSLPPQHSWVPGTRPK